MIKEIFLWVVVLTLAGCTTQTKEAGTPFEKYLNSLETLDTEISYLKGEEASFTNPLRLVKDSFGHISIVNHIDWTIHLIDSEGALIDKVGGIGRGPGEFLGINDLSLGCENKLFVLDKKQSKVVEYEVTSENLIHVKDTILPNYSPLTMQSFYSCDSVSRFGVFKNIRRSNNDYNSRYLYELEDNLELGEKIRELKGDELLRTNSSMDDNPIGFISYWGFEKGKFYYTYSDSLNVNIIDLRSNEIEQVKAPDIPPNKITDEQRAGILEHFKTGLSLVPHLKEEIESRENGSYYHSYAVDEEFSYFADAGIGPDAGFVLRFNHSTQEVSTFSVPGVFQLQDVQGDNLYGIQNRDGELALITITLSD